MAKIRFKCACGKALSVDEKFAGRIAKCPECKRPVQVPAAEGAAGAAGPDSMSDEISSLTDAYGAVILAKARKQRLTAALSEYSKRARKRNRIIAISAVCAVLVVLIGFWLFRKYGPEVGDPTRYPEAVRPFLSSVNDSNAWVRAAATWEIADLGGNAVSALVGDVRHEPDALVCVVKARELARTDKALAPRYLEPLLEHRTLDVRMTAAFALASCTAGELTPRALAPGVLKALGNDKEWAGWLEQATAEGADRAATASFLEARIQSRAARTRTMAAWMTAAALGPDPIMLPLLQDPDPDVAIGAVRAVAPFLTADAFAQLRAEGAAPDALQQRFGVLQNVALRLRHKDVRVRSEAALALAPSGRDETAYLLAQALNDEDWFVRLAAAKGLEALSAQAALPAVREHRDTNAWVQRVITRIIEKAAPAASVTP